MANDDDTLKHEEVPGDEDTTEGGEPMDIDETRKNLGLSSESDKELNAEEDFKNEQLQDEEP